MILLIAGPFLLLSRKARAGVTQKLGVLPAALQARVQSIPLQTPRIWFHAVSVGEFNAVLPLLEEFRSRHPEYKIFISTTTRTGQEQAKAKAGSFAEIFYFPFDLPFAINAWLSLIKPSLVAIVETERWPGFMAECRKRGIKVLLLNGRLSPRSFKSYSRYKFFFAPVLSKFNALAVQTEEEKARFLSLLGNAKTNIKVCGNIKLDGAKAISDSERTQLAAQLKIAPSDFVVVAGSTHEGEESAMLDALKELDFSFKLILVPRHPERFNRVATLIESYGLRARRFSKNEAFDHKNDVYLLDTIGQLSRFYSQATVAFVGGTLANIGGHNLVEPCIYRTPVVCGPHIHKTRELFQKLSDANAIIQLDDEKELKSTIELLQDSPEKRNTLGENGFNFLAQSQGALVRTLELLEEYLDCRGKNSEVRVGTVGGRRK